MDPLTYYTQQSPITDPAGYVGLFADLPRDIAGLSRIVRGLLIHYFADEHVFTYSIPKDRLPEVDTRDVSKMLARILELDDRPLRGRDRPKTAWSRAAAILRPCCVP